MTRVAALLQMGLGTARIFEIASAEYTVIPAQAGIHLPK